MTKKTAAARKLLRSGFAFLILPIALAAAACGGGGSGSKASPPIESATQSATAAVDTSAAAGIDQVDITFKPAKVTVKVGERVRFTNSDVGDHVVDIDGKNISGNMRKGAVIYWTAPQAGTYKVTCDYHPYMAATITVE